MTMLNVSINTYLKHTTENEFNMTNASSNISNSFGLNNQSDMAMVFNQNCFEANETNKAKVDSLLTITDQILIIYPWIMICVGTFSNVISFIVLTRPKLKKSSTFFYLSCLSLIDLLLLFTFCLNFIFLYQFGIDLQLKHIVICKLYSFLIYFLPQFSAWTCTAVSLDRVVGVIFSVRGRYAAVAKRWNTPSKAIRVMLIIFFILFALNFHFLFYPNEYTPNVNEKIQDVNLIYCSPENIPRYQDFYNVWVHIDLSVNVLIPFLVMIASSAIIIVGIIKSTKNLSNNSVRTRAGSRCVGLNNTYGPANGTACTTNAGTSQSTSAAIENVPINAVRFESNASQISQSFILRRLNNRRFTSRNSTATFSTLSTSSKARSVSSMLAANNLVFISLTLPVVLFLSMAPPLTQPDLCDYTKAKLRFVKVICIILMNLNYSINIFIYSLMSSEFRRQLVGLFTRVLSSTGLVNSSNSLQQFQFQNQHRNSLSKYTKRLSSGEKMDSYIENQTKRYLNTINNNNNNESNCDN